MRKLRLGKLLPQNYCRTTTTQRRSACGHRHERGLHQRRERQSRERSGCVRQVPRHPECGGSVRTGLEGGEPSRGREAGAVGVGGMDVVAQEPGELE